LRMLLLLASRSFSYMPPITEKHRVVRLLPYPHIIPVRIVFQRIFWGI
jgi:hypothetical protein